LDPYATPGLSTLWVRSIHDAQSFSHHGLPQSNQNILYDTGGLVEVTISYIVHELPSFTVVVAGPQYRNSIRFDEQSQVPITTRG
jgi:hypothetical protein